ncbi:MAG: hypothetical protein WDO14_00350 [Bacteroidota bacterium]
MKALSALLLITCSFSSFAQTKSTPADTLFGIITFGPKADIPDTVKLTNADGSLWYWFSISKGGGGPGDPQFRPFTYDPDYFGLAMIVTSRKGNRYEFIVDEQTGLKKFVALDKREKLAFVPVRQYILGESTIEFNTKDNPPRKTPDGEVIKVDKKYYARPLDFKGDWLKVKLVDVDDGRSLNIEAWFRWRDGYKLLTYFFKD